jgi:hypothetical protein
MHKQQIREQTKQRQFKTIWVVVVYKDQYAHANWECFCMLYAQLVNLFGMRAVLCLVPATCALYHDVLFFLNNGYFL